MVCWTEQELCWPTEPLLCGSQGPIIGLEDARWDWRAQYGAMLHGAGSGDGVLFVVFMG